MKDETFLRIGRAIRYFAICMTLLCAGVILMCIKEAHPVIGSTILLSVSIVFIGFGCWKIAGETRVK